LSARDLSDRALRTLAQRAGALLLAARRRVATAESCTGGWVAKCLTDIAGSSQWFERGYVTYSNLAKEQSIGVAASVIETFGAVSRPTAEQMAAGALHDSGADLAVAITGIAGPDGGTADKPVGLVWFALAQRGAAPLAEQHQFDGDREAIRRAAVATALQLVIAAAQTQAQTQAQTTAPS
jgi:nicotinamide-nucleotide amidase